MKTRTVAKLIIFGGAILVCLVVLEIAVRVSMKRDEDGNCTFRQIHLKPYHPTVKRAERILAKYQQSTDSVLVYDSELGWALRPNVEHHNAAGFITTQPEVPLMPASDVLRIAVFGGSYTEGTFDHGWWRVLEQQLNAAGVKAEVLNFGVAGYGMDQAYLRWKRDGVRYHPDIVLFGFCAGNCCDNLNLLHMVKDIDSSIPFSKPRFLLSEGELQLVGVPTSAPEAIPGILTHLPEWPLIQYEPYYSPGDFQMKPWRYSRLLAAAEGKACAMLNKPLSEKYYRFQETPAQLGLAITKRFAEEVTKNGSLFCTVNLPHHIELTFYQKHGKLPYLDLLDAVDQLAPMAHPEAALLAECAGRPPEQLYVNGHLNDQLQAVVGKSAAAFILPHAAEWRRH